MDLGLPHINDYTDKKSYNADEISALFGFGSSQTAPPISAIQTLLNQGAEYLSQKEAFALETLVHSWFHYLSEKSSKILSLTPAAIPVNSYTNPLVCPFEIGTVDTGFIAFDWQTCYVLIDALLGGINGVSIEKKQNQPYSDIEKNILQPVFHHLVALMADDRHMVIKPVSLSASLPLQNKSDTRITFIIRTPGATGKICLQLPTAYIPAQEPEKLFQNAEILNRIPLTATAMAGHMTMSLKDVLAFKPGTQLTFPAKRAISLQINSRDIASAKVISDTPRHIQIEGVK